MKDSTNAEAASRERGSFGFAWLLVALALVAFAVMRSGERLEESFVGIRRPPLEVAGWLNTDAPPTDESLRGRVVLVDCWASWCGPCRAKMPHLAEFYQQYRGHGLVLVGLTPESGEELPDLKQYIAGVDGLDWPIGYGADVPMDMMDVHELPTLILFDKSGVSVWASHGLGGLDDAVIAALAGEGSVEPGAKSEEQAASN